MSDNSFLVFLFHEANFLRAFFHSSLFLVCLWARTLNSRALDHFSFHPITRPSSSHRLPPSTMNYRKLGLNKNVMRLWDASPSRLIQYINMYELNTIYYFLQSNDERKLLATVARSAPRWHWGNWADFLNVHKPKKRRHCTQRVNKRTWNRLDPVQCLHVGTRSTQSVITWEMWISSLALFYEVFSTITPDRRHRAECRTFQQRAVAVGRHSSGSGTSRVALGGGCPSSSPPTLSAARRWSGSGRWRGSSTTAQVPITIKIDSMQSCRLS